MAKPKVDILDDFLEAFAKIIIGVLFGIMLIALFAIVTSPYRHEKACLELGGNYIYIADAGPTRLNCYKIIDDSLHYVNVPMEKALREIK